jgi:3-hydroxyisobutyrate dehydrogenase-like beta-hydroxyacid dehydrogenase
MHILMKDIDLAIEQGEELGVPMWVCQAVRLVFKHAIFAGSPDDDMTGIVRFIEDGASFTIPKTR